MQISFLVTILLFVALGSCTKQDQSMPIVNDTSTDDMVVASPGQSRINGALLLTNFKSLEDFKKIVSIHYINKNSAAASVKSNKPLAYMSYNVNGRKISSSLATGVSEADFWKARNGTLWNKISLAVKCPFAVAHKKDLRCIERLGRRRPWEFGKGDVAFYDMAQRMVENISDEDTIRMTPEELDEKGYLNTFNHITAQSFMTSIFSEEIADFVADVHERHTMPELITGDFTEAQLANFEKGPVDNYVDILNNEWGQELGKVLREKYHINKRTQWTPYLMANYLNDIQNYYSYVFKIGFTPFRTMDEKVVRFADKINRVLK